MIPMTSNNLDEEELTTIPQLLNKTELDVNIHFENITCTVPIGQYKFWSKDKKEILKNVSGDFQSNKLTALIGPSGCGKTTLMDVVSGYRIKGVSGYVYVNGVERNIQKLIRQCCYIMQDDKLQPLVTVLEAMGFVANLKLETSVSTNNKEIKIRKILKIFSLLERQNTLIGDLNVSERKRLTVALELISNPPVLFLDEPTSYLDSKSAKEYLEILRKLSFDGRTIVCSVRQPSNTLLNFFDNAYILSEGRCIYQGTVDNSIPYLCANNFDCPMYCNPIEYVIEISQNHVDRLVQAVGNGKSQDWLDSPTCWSTIPLNTLNIKHIQRNQIEDSFQYATPFMDQLRFLLKRILLTSTRNRFATHVPIITNIIIALFLGTLFYDLGNDAARIFANFNLLFLCLIKVMYGALLSRTVAFSKELFVIKREYFNRWYSLKAYFLANILGDIPKQTFRVILFSSIVFYLTNQPFETPRLIQFVVILVFVALIFQDYGTCVGTLMNAKHGLLFGIYSTAPWVIFSGFFLYYRDVPFKFRFIFNVSVVRRAFEAITIVIYGYKRKPMDCYKTNCHFEQPHNFLKRVDVDCDNFLLDFIFLLLIYVIMKCCCYAVLKYKISREI